MSAVDAALAGLEDTSRWQEDLYRDLHMHPERSCEEVRTRTVVLERLESFGFNTQEIGGGAVGVLGNGEGETVLFRADMDALPVTETTGLPYASVTDGVMHACGHDVHVTCALGAAELLARNRTAWTGTYIALFQPAEELSTGARAMVEHGLVDKVPAPEVCLAQHVLTEPEAGHVGTTAGPVLSAGDSLEITVFGTGSHGSMPHLGVDPVVLAATIVVRLQTIVSRLLAPDEFGVVTVGSVHAGSKANVIPDRAVLLLNVRTYDEGVRFRILDAVERIVRAECVAAESPREPEIDRFERYPLTDNDPTTNATVTEAFRSHFGDARVHHLDPVAASEDFSVIPDAFGVPYTYWRTGGFLPGMTVLPNHNPGFAPTMQPTIKTGTERSWPQAWRTWARHPADRGRHAP